MAVVMRQICVALRAGARREAPSRLRVPPAQGLCLRKTGPPRRWLLRAGVSLKGRQTASPLERAPGNCSAITNTEYWLTQT